MNDDRLFDVTLSLEAVSPEQFARVFGSLSSVASGYAMDGFNTSIESSPTFPDGFFDDDESKELDSSDPDTV